MGNKCSKIAQLATILTFIISARAQNAVHYPPQSSSTGTLLAIPDKDNALHPAINPSAETANELSKRAVGLHPEAVHKTITATVTVTVTAAASSTTSGCLDISFPTSTQYGVTANGGGVEYISPAYMIDASMVTFPLWWDTAIAVSDMYSFPALDLATCQENCTLHNRGYPPVFCDGVTLVGQTCFVKNVVRGVSQLVPKKGAASAVLMYLDERSFMRFCAVSYDGPTLST